jgi:hypothetical protein
VANRTIRQDLELTKPKDLPPIPTTPAIIQRRVPGTRTHLSSRQSSKINAGPLLLNGLAMRASHAGHIIEGILDLTLWTMGDEVKFGDEVGKGEFGQIDIFVGSLETFVEVD